jgi:chitinase
VHSFIIWFNPLNIKMKIKDFKKRIIRYSIFQHKILFVFMIIFIWSLISIVIFVQQRQLVNGFASTTDSARFEAETASLSGPVTTGTDINASGGKYILLNSSNNVSGSVPSPMTVISREMPAFTNDDCAGSYPASNGNDSNYDTIWWGGCLSASATLSPTVWLAYDLSSVAPAKRSNVIVAWYANCCSYDTSISGTGAYNIPGSYTIEANAAPGGTNAAPTSGWVTLVAVTGNTYHSRQHEINLTGYNWIRINVSQTDGSVQNYGASINMDVYDASAGTADDFIFYGDSITEGAMGHDTLNGVISFPQLINAQQSANFPTEENGGIGYQTTASALTYIGKQLALFPGKYVGLSFGTNDALGNVDPTTFYNNYAQLIQKVLNAGKVPMVPTIPWGCTAELTANVAGLNQQIQNLYTAYPQIVHGPDLYTYFKNNQSLLSSDCIHPSTPNGMGAYRQQWANTILNTVYKGKVAYTIKKSTIVAQTTTVFASLANLIHALIHPVVNAQTNAAKVNWSSGFYPGWQQAAYPPETLPWQSLTQLNQFSLMTSANRDGSINTTDHGLTPAFMQLAVTEAHKQNKKIYITIGGAEDNNWDAACNTVNRVTFINNLVNIVKEYGYDGVDLDIEQDFGSPDHTDYIACVAGIRNALNNLTPKRGLTEDGDPDWQGYMLAQVWQYLDQINLMTYGATASTIQTELNNYTSMGIPASLLSIGIGLESGEADTTNVQNCIDKAQYALGTNAYNTSHTVYGGVMEWTVPDDAADHNGQYSCLNAIAPYISSSAISASPTISNPTNTPVITTSTPTPQSCSITPPAGTGIATLPNVTLPTAGTYTLFTRMMVPASGNSYYLQIDNNCPIQITDMTGVNSWDWVPSSTQFVYASGTTHTITLYGKDPNVKVDEVLLSQTCTPTGTGDNCVNTATPTVAISTTAPIATPIPTQPLAATPTSTNTPIPTSISSGMGTLTFITNVTANGNFGGSGLSLTLPKNIQPEQLLIAVAGTNGQPASWTTPRGWNLGSGSGTKSRQALYYWWKVATGTESGTKVTFKTNKYADGGVVVAVYNGATTNPIAGASSIATNDNNGDGNVQTAAVNGISLNSAATVVPLIIASWQPNASNITWPSGYIFEATATDGYSFVDLAESSNARTTNTLPSQTLNFATPEAVIQTLQLAIRVR